MKPTRQVILPAALALILVSAGSVDAGPQEKSPAGKPGLATGRSTVTVMTAYPGANAQVVADTVAAPIETQVTGVDKMIFMCSRCDSDGTYMLSIHFAPGTDPGQARVKIQSRVSLALPALPDEVKRQGVKVKTKSAGVLLLVNLSSPGGKYDTIYLSNYANLQIKDELARIAGVGDIVLIGQREYGLRIVLASDKLASRKLTAADVVKALKQINVQVPAGKGLEFQIPSTGPGGHLDPEHIAALVLKTDAGGGKVRLKDVANIELGAAQPDGRASLNGKPGVVLVTYPTGQIPPRRLSTAIQRKLSALRKRLPEGLTLEVAFDLSTNQEAEERQAAPESLLLEPALPFGASAERTWAALEHCESLLHEIEGVKDVLALSDNPFDQMQNQSCILVSLAPPAGREKLIQIIRKRLEKVSGMTLRLRDLAAPGRLPRGAYPIDFAIHGPDADQVRNLSQKLTERLRQSGKLTDLWSDAGSKPQPQLFLDVDRTAVKKHGVAPEDVFNTLQVYFGSALVNDLNRFSRSWQVIVHVEPRHKGQVEAIKQLKVRNTRGEMVALGSFVKVREIAAATHLDFLDSRPMAHITANPSGGVALAEVRRLCEILAEDVRKELRLRPEYRLTWLQEKS
jgi:multidrug efflux pump subunit AcrB